MDDVEEFEHHRGDAAEVAGPRRPAQHVLKASHLDEGAETGRVHHLGRRVEDERHPLGRTHGEVVLEGPRVTGEILLGAELRRVDEYGHRHELSLRTGGADQAGVPLVQRAHRRHQADAPAGPAGLGDRLPHGFDGGGDLRRHVSLGS